MTNEERENAIRCLKLWIEREPQIQTYKTCLEALEQQPCDDAISREAVCNIVNDIRDCISVEGYCAILERLKQLPPVRPQSSERYIDGVHAMGYREGYKDAQKQKCPNCGAKMQESEE